MHLKVGKKFGKLTVIGPATSRTYVGSVASYDKVLCNCGKVKEIRSSSIRLGLSKSCGCSGGPHRLPFGESTVNAFLSCYKYGARIRGLRWSISRKRFKGLVLGNCVYCGEPPRHMSSVSVRRPTPIKMNGIDRKDNSKGYTKDNCTTCCTQCNKMKRTMSSKEFLETVTKIYLHRKGEITCR